MDKKLAGLLGAAAALTTMSSAQAAAPAQQTEIAPASSYRDLLDPVPNALSALKADDARRAELQGTQDQARKAKARRTACGSRKFRCRWAIIITITTIIITAASSFASVPVITTTITTIIIITTITEVMQCSGASGRTSRCFFYGLFSLAILAFAARSKWRYVPSNTVWVFDVHVESAARFGRLP